MKTITPVSVWFNGQEVQASVLNAYVANDNLINLASFNYQLLQIITIDNLEYTVSVVSGTLNMSGEAYENWQTNNYAYEWIAQELNLTIIGDYVRPTPTETSTGTPEPTPTPTPTPSA